MQVDVHTDGGASVVRNSMSATGFLSFFTLRDSVQEGMQAVAAS